MSRSATSEPRSDAVAIVGIGCRLPDDISTTEALASALAQGRDCVADIPPDRWNKEAFYSEDALAPGRTYVTRGGFLNGVDQFDAGFFGISEAEAERIDPQQRICLETVWHALENAGQAGEELRRSNTGVFLAMMNTNNYSQLKSGYEGFSGIVTYDAMADAMSIAAGRIAHFLDLNGPCLALDTACSGSMVALHLARQSILSGDCDSAIVAGVNVILNPAVHIAFSKLGLMSRAGKCQAFDANADGYVRGEGCVAVLLRRESVAVERGDHIVASLLSSAVNQDGHTPALTAPNGRTQEAVIRSALARSGVDAAAVGYVEAHGTGTPVGDPIEMGALTNVYGPGRSEAAPLYVGSVKSNFGHIEAGAGLLGVVKAALSLEQEQIFPSLHHTRMNPGIKLGQVPVQVPTGVVPWPRGGTTRIAGVNSFGYSGTNAHAVLREAPAPAELPDGPPQRSRELVVLSAKSEDGLTSLVDNWLDDLDAAPAQALLATATLGDIAFTAAAGRTLFRHRLALQAGSLTELTEQLRAWRSGRRPRGLSVGQAAVARRTPGTAFVFTGQGAQYAGMSTALYGAEPVFRAAIDECAETMAEVGFDLHEVLYSERSEERLADTSAAQPALFAVGYALAALLREWGVVPSAVIGHSVGELTAAVVAGALPLEATARFVVARGALIGALPKDGAMYAIDATAEELAEWLGDAGGGASVASVNGPRSVVVSGQTDAVDLVVEKALVDGRRPVKLVVSHAFHSPSMEPALADLEAAAAGLTWTRPRVPVASNVTGAILDTDAPGPGYWSRHVREAVQFERGLRSLADLGCGAFVEVGPHPALAGPTMATVEDHAASAAGRRAQPVHVPTLARGQDDLTCVLGTLGALHVRGLGGDVRALYRHGGYQRATLPVYPFRRTTYWIASDVGQLADPNLDPAVSDPLNGRSEGAVDGSTSRDCELTTLYPWGDHRILGATLFPATGYVELAARAAQAGDTAAWQPVRLTDVAFERPYVLDQLERRSLRTDLMSPGRGGEQRFAVVDAGGSTDRVLCSGRVCTAGAAPDVADLRAVHDALPESWPVGGFYGQLRQAGLVYGMSFATIRSLHTGGSESGEAVSRIAASPSPDQRVDHSYTMTTTLDGCLQTVAAAIVGGGEHHVMRPLIPVTARAIALHRDPGGELWVQARAEVSESRDAAVAHIVAVDDEGRVVYEVDGLEMRVPSLTPDVAAALPGRAAVATVDRNDVAVIEAIKSETDPDQQLAALIDWLVGEVRDTVGSAAEEIGLDDIDPSTAFMEVGLDSLKVTELQRRIQEKLDFRFEPMQGLDYQSIDSLARFLQAEVLRSTAVSENAVTTAAV